MAQDMSSAGLIDLPVIPPPPGVLPDFDHPPTRTLEAYIGMGVCIGVTLVFIVLRLYVKSAITHQWGWDDGEFQKIGRAVYADKNSGLHCRICKFIDDSLIILVLKAFNLGHSPRSHYS